MPDNRRLVVTENISVNGVVEFVDDWFDPADQEDAEDLFAAMHDQMASEEALLLGRKTFEDFRGYWPLQTDDASGSTAHLNRVLKYVVSSTMTDPAWANTTDALRGRPRSTRSRPLKSTGRGRRPASAPAASACRTRARVVPASSTSTGCSSTRCSAAVAATSCPVA